MPYKIPMSKEEWKRYRANPDHYLHGRLVKPYNVRTRTATGKTVTLSLYGTSKADATGSKRRS